MCRVVRGLKNLRIGAIGARPAAFNTVRYSERIYESHGIAVEPIDLSEILGRINRMGDNDDAAQAKLAAIKKYVSTGSVPDAALLKMAKLGAVIDSWMKQNHITISAIQCWTSLEEYFGVVPCTIMSMMSEDLIPSACEVDVPGTLSMYMLALASGTPSALLDWNNNYGDDPDKAVCFHCSNLPKHFFKDVTMDYQAIIAGTVGIENTFGTCVGRVKSGAMSYARYSTDDRRGVVRGYTGEGHFTDDPLETFGGAGVVEIPKLQSLLKYICREGFEHHVAANFSQVAPRHSRSGRALSRLRKPISSEVRGLIACREWWKKESSRQRHCAPKPERNRSRLDRLFDENDISAVLLRRSENIAWATCGQVEARVLIPSETWVTSVLLYSGWAQVLFRPKERSPATGRGRVRGSRL